jgi:O-antigen/teichoic acid export membrane protein
VTAAGDLEDPSGSEEYFWSQRKWWRKVGSTSIAIWGSTALTFVGSIVAARGLGPDDYGVVVLAIATASFVSIFLDLTLTDGVVYHGSRAIAAADFGNLRSLLRAAFFSDLAVGIVITALLVALADPVAQVASGGKMDPSLLRLAALVGLATTVDSTTGAVLLLAGRPDLQGWMMAVGNVTRLIAIVAAIQLFGSPASVIAAYVIAALTSALAQMVVAWQVAWKQWRQARPARSARSWVRPLLSFGIYTSLTTTLLSTEKAVVPILLGAFAGPAAAGFYNVGLLPLTIVFVGSAPLRLALFPEQSKLAARGDLQALRRTVRGMTRIGFALAIPGAIAAWFIFPALIPALFSEKFESAVAPAQIMLGAAVFQFAIGSWAKSLPAAIGRPKLRTAMSAAYMAISVGLTVLLGPGLESRGGAIATTAAAVSTSVGWWFLGDRVLRPQAMRPGREEGAPSSATTPPEPTVDTS